MRSAALFTYLSAMKLRRLAPLLFLVCISFVVQAQYTTNPMLNTTWTSFGLGANSSDNFSYQLFASKSTFEETVSTTVRAAYSQELFEGQDDSIFFQEKQIVRSWCVMGTSMGKEQFVLGCERWNGCYASVIWRQRAAGD